MKNLNILLASIAIASITVSCGSKTPATAVAEADTTVYLVKTLTLEKQKIARHIEYTANLMPFEEINYAPASPGRIEEIVVEVGSRVKKGDVIARMEQTQLQQASEQLQSARTNFERMDTLHKLNSVSDQVYEAAKTQYEVSKTSFDFLKKNTTLVSPINGIVTGKVFRRRRTLFCRTQYFCRQGCYCDPDADQSIKGKCKCLRAVLPVHTERYEGHLKCGHIPEPYLLR